MHHCSADDMNSGWSAISKSVDIYVPACTSAMSFLLEFAAIWLGIIILQRIINSGSLNASLQVQTGYKFQYTV